MTQYATFFVGEERVGVAVEHVHEILTAPPWVAVPLAPDGVLGLLSRRGEIVTVLDGRALLGLAPTEAAPPVHVIVTLDGETVSLAVDAEGDVMSVDDARSHAVPETVAPTLRRALSAVYELEDGGLMLALYTGPTRVAA